MEPQEYLGAKNTGIALVEGGGELRKEIQPAFSQVKLKAIAAEGVNPQDHLNPNLEMREVHDASGKGLEGTATNDNTVQRHERYLKCGSTNANNPSRSGLLEVQLMHEVWINRALRGSSVR
jgi:hypothetical protein